MTRRTFASLFSALFLPPMPTIAYVDPSHNYTARGDRSLRSRRGPFRCPNGALYTHLQDANSSGFGLWKSIDSGATWSNIHTFDRALGGGWVSDGNVEQADMQQAATADHLLFLVYPYDPGEVDVDWHAYEATVKLAVIDTTTDTITEHTGPAMNISDNGANPVKASVVLVAPSPDGTSAHIAYTKHNYGGIPGSGGSQSVGVEASYWNGSGFSAAAVGGTEAHPCTLVNLGAGVSNIVMYQEGTPDVLLSYVLTGTAASDGQTLESGNLLGTDNIMTGFGASYAIGGGQYRICIPVPHPHSTASSNYIPAALVGTYSGGSITWAASVELLAEGTSGSDVGSYHTTGGAYGDIATHMHAAFVSGALYVYWVAGQVQSPAGLLASPIKLQRAKYTPGAGTWSAAATLYNAADLDPTFTGFGDVWVTAAGLLLHPDITDSGAPDPDWMSPYYIAISGAGPAARYRGI